LPCFPYTDFITVRPPITDFSLEPKSVIAARTQLSCWFLFPFYADEFNPLMVRIKNGEILLKAHRKHIYQLLANEKGMAHWKVSLGYGVFQALVGLSVLWIKPLGLFPVLLILVFWFSAFFIFSAFIRRSIVPDIGDAG